MYNDSPNSIAAEMAEPTLESLLNSIRESKDRISKAVSATTDQLGRLGFVQLAPTTPEPSNTKDNGPGRERTAMERMIELCAQLKSAAYDCEWNQEHLQKQF